MVKILVERKGRFASLWELRVFKVSFLVAGLFLLAATILPLWRLFPGVMSQEVVPLHYNIHYGVDWTGVWWQIFTLPVLGLICLVVNFLVALWLIKRNLLLTKIVLIASVILSAFLFLAMVFTVSLNIVYG